MVVIAKVLNLTEDKWPVSSSDVGRGYLSGMMSFFTFVRSTESLSTDPPHPLLLAIARFDSHSEAQQALVSISTR